MEAERQKTPDAVNAQGPFLLHPLASRGRSATPRPLMSENSPKKNLQTRKRLLEPLAWRPQADIGDVVVYDMVLFSERDQQKTIGFEI